jgi:hypothetical protein
MAYIECPKCGYQALSVATRCPRCGQEFPTPLIRHPVSGPQIRKLWPLLVLAGILTIVAVMNAVLRPRVAPAVLTESLVAPPLDSVRYIPIQPVAETAAPAGEGSRPLGPLVSEAPPPDRPQVKLYATTWVNIREHRSGGTAAVRILNPGEAVLVDSLVGGWYRIVVDGRTLGYVDRSYLDTAAPLVVP